MHSALEMPKQLDGKRELPALRERDGGANAGVGAGAEAEGETLDFFALDARFGQRFFDERERVSCAGDGFHRFTANFSFREHGDAALFGGKFNRQNLHK